MNRWRAVLVVLSGLFLAVGLWFAWSWINYPSDKTPEGAYYRVVKAVNNGVPEQFFAYLETPAQHAAYSIRDYRRKARKLVLATFPEPERSRLAAQYAAAAAAPDGADVFALYARQGRWLDRLRRDVSGIASTEVEGERATVETARGTRYSFRRRENGIWGLSMFTAVLVGEGEKAARDYAVIEQAAADYRRVDAQKPAGAGSAVGQ